MFTYVSDPGFLQPFGVSRREGGLNFALFSSSAESVRLCLYSQATLLEEIPMHRTGDVWHLLVKIEPSPDLYYAYRVDQGILLQDPYAREVASTNRWGARHAPEEPYNPLSATFIEEPFDWQGVEAPHISRRDLIIYEMHVRGLTQHPSAHVQHPGTFLGVVEKIPELLKLGINAVELLPIQEFDEQEVKLIDPESGKLLYNFWGYSTVNFFAPMNRYASSEGQGVATREFKTLVRELHRNGIEVILDVVFNHTAEGNREGPILSYKGIENAVYYLLDADGDYSNYSGCGNSLNANHPVVRALILDALRYWALEMHVDGFRFDLASALTRGRRGEPLDFAPLIDAITEDPLLPNVKLIAEPWDAAGLYQVGHFWPSSPQWSEWNGKYRDSVRRFIKGTFASKGDFVTRLCGSEDLYYSRSPLCSINFVTIHDGFTLRDLVSYNEKHNRDNGEENRDGTSQNDSWNCGVEGATEKESIQRLRERQMRNFHLVLMLSQGVPLLLMGDEYGHTKEGNNNSWCHDDARNWFLWDKLDENRGFYRFYQKMIHFRKAHPLLRRNRFFSPGEIEWHGVEPFKPDWSHGNLLFACTFIDPEAGHDLYVAFNAQDRAVELELPSPNGGAWSWVVHTGNPSPDDFYDAEEAPQVKQLNLLLPSFAAILLKRV